MEDAQIRLAKAPDDKKADVAKHIAKEIIAQGYDRTTNSFIRKPNSRVDCLLKEMQEQKLLPADNTTLRNR